MLQDLYLWLISAIGGFVGSCLLLVSKWGENLIQSRASKALEAFKAQQSRDLEDIKEKLSHLSDRGKRSNEMEFQSIQKVWKAFVKAWLSTNTCSGELIRYPDFSRMTEVELRSFATSSDLNDDEQELLLKAADKGVEYLSIRRWRTILRAGDEIYACRLILREQRIFMPTQITEDFDAAIDRMNAVQVERRLSLENPSFAPNAFGNRTAEWNAACTTIFDSLASTANKRLFRGEIST